MDKKQRKAKITPETLAESKRLLELWNKRSPKISQVEFGEKYGIGSQGAVYQFLRGRTPLSMKAAIGFAEGLGVDIADFSMRLAKEAVKIAEATTNTDEFLPVKMLNVEFSAGNGRNGVEIVEEIGVLHFRKDFMCEKNINTENAAIVRVKGESMEPTITDKSVVLIAQNDTSPKTGNIYAFVHDGELLIKRFFFEDGVWKGRSDNTDKKKYKDVQLKSNSKILGRAIWVGMSL